jgi:hypothetical protein
VAHAAVPGEVVVDLSSTPEGSGLPNKEELTIKVVSKTAKTTWESGETA